MASFSIADTSTCRTEEKPAKNRLFLRRWTGDGGFPAGVNLRPAVHKVAAERRRSRPRLDDLTVRAPALAAVPRLNEAADLPPAGIDLEQLERSLVVQALERSAWNQTRAATLLGLNRDQIRYRIEKFKLEKPAAW
jgi:transcriptional regulator with GAF, ATPase, and Fis domain